MHGSNVNGTPPFSNDTDPPIVRQLGFFGRVPVNGGVTGTMLVPCWILRLGFAFLRSGGGGGAIPGAMREGMSLRYLWISFSQIFWGIQ